MGHYLDYRIIKMGRNIIATSSRLLVKTWQKTAGIGLMGTKAGMTTWFVSTGEAVPCTVIALEGRNTVTQIKTQITDGYTAVQVGYKAAKEKNMTKPEIGHL